MFPKKLIEKLNIRKLEENYRELNVFNPNGIDFFSNDYLGLSKNPDLLEIYNQNKKPLGSTGSRLMSGNTAKMEEVEAYLAQYYGFQAGLTFGSGYMANLALFSTIAEKSDTIIYDQNIHASAREGIRLSLAKSFSFAHNNWEDLRKKIGKAHGNIFVAVEGIYSMNGDSPDLQELLELIEEENIYLIVDEAHSVGVMGEKGKGITENIPKEKLFAVLYTFGKALGYHGAFVAGNEQLKNILVNFAKPFIYTTALPENDFVFIKEIHHYLEKNFKDLIIPLRENVELFRKNYESDAGNSPIKIIQAKNIIEVENELLTKKIQTKIIKHPTVDKGKEILRIVLHSFNTKDEIHKLTEILNNE